MTEHPTESYVAVPVESLRLVVSRYLNGDTSVDEPSDQAVFALLGALNRWDDTDGGEWPGVEAPDAKDRYRPGGAA